MQNFFIDVKMRNLDTNLIKNKGISYRKLKESLSISKRKKTMVSIEIGGLTSSVPNFKQKTMVLPIKEYKEPESSSKSEESKQQNKGQMHLKAAIKKIFTSNNILGKDLDPKNELLK